MLNKGLFAHNVGSYTDSYDGFIGRTVQGFEILFIDVRKTSRRTEYYFKVRCKKCGKELFVKGPRLFGAVTHVGKYKDVKFLCDCNKRASRFQSVARNSSTAFDSKLQRTRVWKMYKKLSGSSLANLDPCKVLILCETVSEYTLFAGQESTMNARLEYFCKGLPLPAEYQY